MTAKTAKNDVKTMSVRFPKRVAKDLQKRAKEQGRSVNAQIVHECIANSVEYASRQPVGVPV